MTEVQRRLESPEVPETTPQYPVVYEQGADGGWGAYCPDLPGLGVGAETRAECETLIREGIVYHLEGLREEGMPIPPPGSAPSEKPAYEPSVSNDDAVVLALREDPAFAAVYLDVVMKELECATGVLLMAAHHLATAFPPESEE